MCFTNFEVGWGNLNPNTFPNFGLRVSKFLPLGRQGAHFRSEFHDPKLKNGRLGDDRRNKKIAFFVKGCNSNEVIFENITDK